MYSFFKSSPEVSSRVSQPWPDAGGGEIMHPVLSDAVFPFAGQIAAVTRDEAQTHPDDDPQRWCGQAVVEHLILDFLCSRNELQMRLKNRDSPSRAASLQQWILKIQTCLLAWMPDGLPAPPGLRPGHFSPQEGAELASRLTEAAQQLDAALVQCRIVFGMRPCGYHSMYGPLRVEEWRVYHAAHCRRHQRQFEKAIRAAQRQREAVS